MVLPADAARAGRIQLFPYQRAIAGAMDDPTLRQVSMMVYSQMGKTTLEVGHMAKAVISGIRGVFGMPSDRFLSQYVSMDMEPLIAASPYINDNIRRNNHRKIHADGLRAKDGSVVAFRTPGSKAGFGGAHAPLAWADEVDEYVSGAAASNPLDLLRSRRQSYSWGKIVVSSTPSKTGGSLIEEEFNRGTREEWYVPCVHGGRPTDWHVWGIDAIAGLGTDNPRLVCFCGSVVVEEERIEAVWLGEFRPTNDNPEPGHRSFHLSQLVSLSTSFEDMANEYRPESPTGFMTQRMGLPYSVTVSEALEGSDLRVLYGEPPDDPRIARCIGVDPGGYGLDYQILDVYPNPKSDAAPRLHILGHYKLNRDRHIGHDESWRAVYAALGAAVADLRPDIVMVDVGNEADSAGANHVLAHVRAQPRLSRLHREGRIVPIKGTGTRTGTDVLGEKRFSRAPVESALPVNVSLAKDNLWPLLVDAVRVPESRVLTIGPDYRNFSEDFDGELADSYRLQRTPRQNGTELIEWVKNRKQKNRREGFDCWQYAWLGWIYLGRNAKPPVSAEQRLRIKQQMGLT